MAKKILEITRQFWLNMLDELNKARKDKKITEEEFEVRITEILDNILKIDELLKKIDEN